MTISAPLADAARLASWLGLGEYTELPQSEQERAAEVVGTISDLVRGEARQTWTLTDVPADVAAIVLMVSVECFGNPDRKTSVTIEEITRRWANGDLFSASQLSTIRAYRPGESSGVGSAEFSLGRDYSASGPYPFQGSREPGWEVISRSGPISR